MYAWEKPFAVIVECIRAAEMQKIQFVTYVRAVYLSFVVFTSRTVLFLTLLAFVLMGNSLRPDITFTLATYFEVLQFSFAFFFPQALILVGESMVSIRRLEVCNSNILARRSVALLELGDSFSRIFYC